MNTFLILLFIVPGVMIFLLGKYIRKTGYVEVLKSYDEKNTYDREGLTKYSSNLMMYTGAFTVAMSLLSFLIAVIFDFENIKSYFLILYVLLMINYILRLKFSCNKFLMKKEL